MIFREHGLFSSITGWRILERIFAVIRDGVEQIKTVNKASVKKTKSKRKD
jgi:hypothetical protein